MGGRDVRGEVDEDLGGDEDVNVGLVGVAVGLEGVPVGIPGSVCAEGEPGYEEHAGEGVEGHDFPGFVAVALPEVPDAANEEDDGEEDVRCFHGHVDVDAFCVFSCQCCSIGNWSLDVRR